MLDESNGVIPAASPRFTALSHRVPFVRHEGAVYSEWEVDSLVKAPTVFQEKCVKKALRMRALSGAPLQEIHMASERDYRDGEGQPAHCRAPSSARPTSRWSLARHAAGGRGDMISREGD